MQSDHVPNNGQDSEMKAEFSGKSLANELRPDAADARSVDKYADELLRPIPVEMVSVAGWKDVPLTEGKEPLEALGPFSDNNDIFTSSIYYGEHDNSPYVAAENRLDGSLITMFVREEVATCLRHAQQLLPEGYHLIVLDAYRTLAVQQALYDHYLGALTTKHPDWDEAALSTETQKYVSLPSTVESRPSPHNTGGAVDLAIYRLPSEINTRVTVIDDRLDELKAQFPANPTPYDEAYDPALRESYILEMEKIGLIRLHAEFLNFGTQFDYGGREAASNYLEKLEQERPLTPDEIEARDSRRMLYNAMVQTGMQPYEDEWWHFNSPKSQMGAMVAGLPSAEYGGVALDQDNIRQEKMREMHRAGLIRIDEGLAQRHHFIGKVNPLLNDLNALNEYVVNETGDPRVTDLPKAALMEPPEAAAA